MASPLTERLLDRMSETDPETGCVGMGSDVAFQLCRQNYFLKQQNQILQSQQSSQKLNGENIQLETVSQSNTENFTTNLGFVSTNPAVLYGIILFLVVIVTVVITKLAMKNN